MADTQKKREDGFVNALTGLGDPNFDKRKSTRFKAALRMNDRTLTAMYRSNGLTRRIMNLQPIEMTRNWFKITGDEEDKVLQKLETLGAQEAYTDGMIWARLYGGAVILMGLNDGNRRGQLWRPVREDKIKDVDYLKVFDKTDVEVVEGSVSTDPTDPLFGEPTKYKITPVTGGAAFTVHASRLIRFDGAKVPNRTLWEQDGWHDSVMMAIYEQIRQIGAVFDSSEFIVNEFIMTIVQIDNMLEMIMNGQDDLLKQRLNMLDLSKHVKNTLLMDAKEGFAKHSSTVTGLDTLLDRFMMLLSSVTGYPVTLLMGRSPAGQNATGESDFRMWYDKVRSGQRTELRPRLEPLIRYIFKSLGGEPETWSVEFNPLWEMTEKEHADVYKTNAEGDNVYVMNGTLGSDQVARYRFGGQQYNAAPPTVEQDDLDDQENAARQAEEERAKMQAEAEAAAAQAAEEE
jgi:phage-related protein (TIGR01555 family)